ncbi:hypothetical protein ACRZ5S_07210 [Vibrio scophthalmi]|uniref:hypothetical protein n=1 Tax=Vibrio scophthalmi TaxID=45658 RepID=UPI003EB761D9
MQYPKLSLCAALIIISLSGCGGSSDSDSTSDNHVLKAIDGYLIGAEVYIDRNNNGRADANEKLASLTNDSGEITIPNADKQFKVIIRAVAGETRDSDKGGTVDQTFDLIAQGSNAVATPFTTIAHAQNKNIETLAAELGFEAETLGQDYIALKQNNSDAQAVHLFARSIAPELSGDLNSIGFTQRMATINQTISQLVNTGSDLDQLSIHLSDTGIASTTPMQPTLSEFLDNQPYISTSLNDFWRTRDNGIELASWLFDINNRSVELNGHEFSLNFDEHNPNSFFVTWPEGQSSECEIPYQAEMCRSEMQDNFIFIDNDFALAISIDGDIQVYLRPSASESINYELNGFDSFDLSSTHIEQNGYYHLDDLSSNWSPQPALVRLNQGAITVFDAQQGFVNLDSVAHTVLRGNNQIYLIKRQSDNHPSLLFRNEELANLIKSKWENHTLIQPQ